MKLLKPIITQKQMDEIVSISMNGHKEALVAYGADMYRNGIKKGAVAYGADMYRKGIKKGAIATAAGIFICECATVVYNCVKLRKKQKDKEPETEN